MSRVDQFWRWAGFHEANAMPPKEWGSTFAASKVWFPLSFTDRLRVLISGKVSVDMAHKFDRPPRAWKTVSEIAVLPPNY